MKTRFTIVIIGGSWYYSAAIVQVSARSWSGPGSRYNDLGFRLVKG